MGVARALAGLTLLAACACAHRAGPARTAAARQLEGPIGMIGPSAWPLPPAPVEVEPAREPEAAPVVARPASTYKVRAGDTLYSIARAHGVGVNDLATANGLDDPSRLAPGQSLRVPAQARALAQAERPQPLGRTEQRRPRGPASVTRATPGRPLHPAAAGRALEWPVRGVLYSPYGPRSGAHHDGVDLAAPEGTPVVAAEDGVVVFAGQQRGYGLLVLVRHDRDLVTVYAHNEANLVRAGDRVKRGQQIARVGRTGDASGPHVHFEVRVEARPADPLAFLR